MAKLAQTSVKYLIKIEFNAEGTVEKPDIIGALFGQTEGLLGSELDLRELQRTGRIGRIDVDVKVNRGKSVGTVFIPSSLSNTETALIAATLETIERIGPCDAKLAVKGIEDIRSVKRTHIKSRAQSLLQQMARNSPELATITEEINDAVRVDAIVEYEGLPAGPEVSTSEDIILCEGRADVLTLLKSGIKNALAVGGTNIPPNIKEVTKQKGVTLFLDGDRGGDLIMKALSSVVDVDFVARAPEGKEVEELTKKEIYKSLRSKTPVNQAKPISGSSVKQDIQTKPLRSVRTSISSVPQSSISRSRPVASKFSSKTDVNTLRRAPARNSSFSRASTTYSPRPSFSRSMSNDSVMRAEELGPEKRELYKKQLEELVGTRAASIYDKNDNFAGRVPTKELAKAVTQVSNPKVIVMDGKIDRRTCEVIEKTTVSLIVSTEKDTGLHTKVAILVEKDL